MTKKSIADDPDSPRGNIIEDFKYFFKVSVSETYNTKKHPILARIMYLITLIFFILAVDSLLIIMQYYIQPA